MAGDEGAAMRARGCKISPPGAVRAVLLGKGVFELAISKMELASWKRRFAIRRRLIANARRELTNRALILHDRPRKSQTPTPNAQSGALRSL